MLPHLRESFRSPSPRLFSLCTEVRGFNGLLVQERRRPYYATARAHAQSRCWVVPVRSSPGSFVRGGGETTFPGRPSQSQSLMGAFTPSPSFSDFAGTQKRFVLGQSPKIASLCLPLAPLEQDPQLHLPSPQSALHTVVGPK